MQIMEFGEHERVYFIRGSKCSVLIDCGSEATVGENLENMKSSGVDPGEIKAILVTHAHFDHISGLARAKTEIGCDVIAHVHAAGPIEEGDPLYTAAVMKYLDIYTPFPPCKVDYKVEDGDTVELGDFKFKVYHLPGHSPCCVAYEIDGNLFSGDVMFEDGGIGWIDIHWGSNLADYKESLERLKDIAPSRIYPGHGNSFDFSPELVKKAIDKIDKLSEIGTPAKMSIRYPSRKGKPKSIRPELGKPEEKPASKSTVDLSSSKAYEFRTGNITGFIRPKGHLHGLILNSDAGIPITSPGACTLNLEHYCSKGKTGAFVPRNDCATYWDVYRDSLIIHFHRTADWLLETSLNYDIRDDGVIDVTFDFEFLQDYTDFEAFIASYFYGQRIPFICANGKWFRPDIRKGEQLFFARDEVSASQVTDGRWEWLGKSGLFATADPRKYSYPMIVSWDEKTKWAFIQMVQEDMCPALSVNTFAYAQDLSLVGKSVKAGEKVQVRIRAIYRQINSPEDTISFYRAFSEEFSGESRKG